MNNNVVEILIVEDNPDDEELTLHALKRVNLINHIHVSRDGAEALDYIFGKNAQAAELENTPRLIFLDLKLPKIDGMEVLERLKTDARTRMIPVVMLTSSREERDVVESYQLGVNSYIVKPVDFEQFTQSVGQAGLYWAVLNEPPRF
ncbi:MAG: response regulator [Anaerolineae bacterium]